jgi:hypothetical protein
MAKSSIRLDPEHWRARAEEARAAAANIVDLDSRRLMLEVASTYDRLAVQAEARGADKGPSSVGS